LRRSQHERSPRPRQAGGHGIRHSPSEPAQNLRHPSRRRRTRSRPGGGFKEVEGLPPYSSDLSSEGKVLFGQQPPAHDRTAEGLRRELSCPPERLRVHPPTWGEWTDERVDSGGTRRQLPLEEPRPVLVPYIPWGTAAQETRGCRIREKRAPRERHDDG